MGYTTLSIQEFIAIQKGEAPLPEKAVLLTFDDGYKNNLTYVYPMLQEFNWNATLFVIAGTLDGSYPQAGDAMSEYLTPDDLRTMNAKYMQLAIHGYQHEDFSKLSLDKAVLALTKSVQVFDECGLPYHKIIGWPYGARPKDHATLKGLKQWLKTAGFEAGFRIGNKPAIVPAKDLYEIHRIDIRGDDTMDDFRLKLRKGKLKPF